jgi:hypothetical protein
MSDPKRVAVEAFMFFASKNIKPQLTGPVWTEIRICVGAIKHIPMQLDAYLTNRATVAINPHQD